MMFYSPFAFPTIPLTFSQLNPIVGTVFRYWSNFSLYNAVVLPAESNPNMTTWRVPWPDGRASSKEAFLLMPAPIDG